MADNYLNVRIPKEMKKELQKEADEMYRGNLSYLVFTVLKTYLGEEYYHGRNGKDEKI